MGRLNNGLFGGFQGRVGNLVGYMLNGKSVIRTIGHSGKPLTLPRKANCQKMSVINDFLRNHLNFIRTGFRLITAGTDQNFYNAAVSYNKKHALQGEYPNISMDYPKALLSMGSLLKADKPEISLQGTAVEFKWEVPADLAWRNKNDRAMLVIHFPDADISTTVMSGSRRHEGRELVLIDPNLVESRMEAYISFINEDATEISESVHAGSLNLQQTTIKEKQEEPKSVIQHKPKKAPVKADKKPTQQAQTYQWTSSQFNASGKTYNYSYSVPPY
ncbi:DUF6266 family protein [Pedobacter gandavensis]|uniref:DUF6266 family protein n=1 Tax=Pedobacter gandavensis TaxID=2679963 RepID=UPI00292F7B83|nr:DUF6266 family protein [Pedobacter gandavensis]